MNFLSHFHFLRPLWFLMLIPLIVLLPLLQRVIGGGNHWKKVIDSHLLPYLLVTKNSMTRRISTENSVLNPQSHSSFRQTAPMLSIILAGIIWFIAVFALAGPTWSRLIQPVYQSRFSKVILLDLSPSMLATDLPPNRFTRAKYKIDDILSRSREGQTGMAVFTKEAYTVSPLTNDTKTIAAMMPSLSPKMMPVWGSNISVGLKQAEKLLKDGGAKEGIILLITDSDPSMLDYKIAQKIHHAGYTLSILGVGTKVGAPIPDMRDGFFTVKGKTVIAKLDTSALKKLAKLGGGDYAQFTNSDSDIESLLSRSNREEHLMMARKTKARTEIWKDEGRWFIFLLLPFVLLLFRRGVLEEICK